MKILNSETESVSNKGDSEGRTFSGKVFFLIEDITLITSEPDGGKFYGLELFREEKLKNALFHVNLNLQYLKSKLLLGTIFGAVKDDDFNLTLNDSYNLITNIIANLEELYSIEWQEVRGENLVQEIEKLMDALTNKHGSLGDHLPQMKTALDSLKDKYDPIHMYIARIIVAGNILFKIAELLGVKLSKTEEKIVRSIIFPPELKQACIGVLSYFSHVLSVKYPEEDVEVNIEQLGRKVILLITTPEGKKERIEKDLSDYGLVVIGELAPEQFLIDPFEVLRLKQKLEIAALELRQTKELLYNERGHFNARIDALENEAKNVWRQLDVQQHDKKELISTFNDLYIYANDYSKESLRILIGLIEKGNIEKDQQEIKELIQNIKANDKGLWAQFEELIIKGSIQGTAGNILFVFLQSIALSIR